MFCHKGFGVQSAGVERLYGTRGLYGVGHRVQGLWRPGCRIISNSAACACQFTCDKLHTLEPGWGAFCHIGHPTASGKGSRSPVAPQLRHPRSICEATRPTVFISPRWFSRYSPIKRLLQMRLQRCHKDFGVQSAGIERLYDRRGLCGVGHRVQALWRPGRAKISNNAVCASRVCAWWLWRFLMQKRGKSAAKHI